jgi:hypothetical protein
MRANYLAAVTAVVTVSTIALGCSKKSGDSSRTSNEAMRPDSSAAPSASTATSPSGLTPVRGRLVSVTDSVLTVSSANGEVRVALIQPVQVYTSEPAQLSRVAEGSFVGVTSVPQPDGRQRATEIHIFPEELRGTGEGSYLMAQQGGGGENRSRMSNGTVGGSRMTNGAASRMTNGAASRMTNGAAGGQAGGALTVNYNGGSQTITIPSGITVTAIVPTHTKLAAGEDVVVLANKQPDGTLGASRVLTES